MKRTSKNPDGSESSELILIGGKDSDSNYFNDCYLLNVTKNNQDLQFKWTKIDYEVCHY